MRDREDETSHIKVRENRMIDSERVKDRERENERQRG